MCTNEMRFCQHKRWFNQHMDSPCHRDWLYPKRKLDYLELKLTNESWDLGLLRICSIYHQSMAKKNRSKKGAKGRPYFMTLWHLWPETGEFLSSTPSDGAGLPCIVNRWWLDVHIFQVWQRSIIIHRANLPVEGGHCENRQRRVDSHSTETGKWTTETAVSCCCLGL